MGIISLHSRWRLASSTLTISRLTAHEINSSSTEYHGQKARWTLAPNIQYINSALFFFRNLKNNIHTYDKTMYVFGPGESPGEGSFSLESRF